MSGTNCNGALTRRTSKCAAPPACPKACEWAQWQAWTTCSAECGEGTQTRSRSYAVPPSAGATPCLGTPTEGPRACYIKACGSGCVKTNCQLSEWLPWSPCSQTCGGTHTRIREVSQQAACGGSCANVPQEDNCSLPECGGGGEVTPAPPAGGGLFRCRFFSSILSTRCSFVEVTPQPSAATGNGLVPTPVMRTNQQQQKPGVDESSGMSVGAIAAIAAAGGICCLILLAALIIAAFLFMRGGNARGDAQQYAPAQQSGAVGNPLFSPQEDKHYSPVFYGNDGAGSSVGSYPGAAGGAGAAAACTIVFVCVFFLKKFHPIFLSFFRSFWCWSILFSDWLFRR